jgi:predicted ArsR family transcriptional regulator
MGANMRQAGMNMGRVKQQNRSAILNYICEVGPVSRKDIASDMGLTPAAVTQITT